MIDACMKGFGAGAGNTQIELLVAVLERYGNPINTSFDRIAHLAETSASYLTPGTPHIQAANIASGLYGLFSGFVPHVQRAAKHFSIDEYELFKRLAERCLVAGQEDVIFEEASKLASPRPPPSQAGINDSERLTV